MLTKQTIQQRLRSNHSHFASKYGVKRIGLFGSYANGVPADDGDVDLVVEFSRPVGFRFMELADELETLLGRKVDLLTPSGLEGIRLSDVAEKISRSVEYA
ncbi:MAG: nucleotidyltransferase family protein [Acidobacteriota bacterium]